MEVAGFDRKRILIVDDDPNYLGILKQWIGEDFKTFMSNSGMRALKWLENNTADLILLDVEMPKLSGPEVLGLIRQNDKAAGTPVMFLTGRDDINNIKKNYEKEVAGFIKKTAGRDEVLGAIHMFLDH